MRHRRERIDNMLGDGPIEQQFINEMRATADALDRIYNGEATGADRKTGFILLVFPFNDHKGRCNYISNGAAREDVVALMKEQIARFEGRYSEKEGKA